ncbi:3124_t:CDS:1, partial [Scutellospora calospora]
AFAPIPSILFINYMTDTYVSRLFMYLPPSLRYNPKQRKVFNPYVLQASGDPIITIEMYDWLTRRVEIDVKLSELKDFPKKKSLVTWIKDTSDKSGKNKFYVAKGLMNQDPFSKGLVEWIEKNSNTISITKATNKD